MTSDSMIQKLVPETYVTPQRGESFLRKAAGAFALYLAALAVPSKGKQAGNFWRVEKT